MSHALLLVVVIVLLLNLVFALTAAVRITAGRRSGPAATAKDAGS